MRLLCRADASFSGRAAYRPFEDTILAPYRQIVQRKTARILWRRHTGGLAYEVSFFANGGNPFLRHTPVEQATRPAAV